MRILVIDDSPMIRGYLGELLPGLGHEVVGEAASPDEAVAAYKLHRPDLVTLDLGLAGGDGFSVLESIRAFDAKARVLVMTANTQKLAADRALASGAIGVLNKPFVAAELQAMLALAAG